MDGASPLGVDLCLFHRKARHSLPRAERITGSRMAKHPGRLNMLTRVGGGGKQSGYIMSRTGSRVGRGRCLPGCDELDRSDEVACMTRPFGFGRSSDQPFVGGVAARMVGVVRPAPTALIAVTLTRTWAPTMPRLIQWSIASCSRRSG
jgi:hypothetical protein